MKKDIKLFAFLGILIIFVIILLIGCWLNLANKNDIESVVIEKNNQENYDNKIISSYEEYQNILSKFNIWGKLTDADFQKYDYIADFIPYEENMQIISIKVNISNVINIIYETNPEVGKNSSKLLLNFIPISKGLITGNIAIENEFK